MYPLFIMYVPLRSHDIFHVAVEGKIIDGELSDNII